MQMTQFTRTLSTKRVHIARDGNYTPDEVISFALKMANERLDRLTFMGAQVTVTPTEYLVTLHTD